MSALRGRHIELWVEAREGQPAVNPVMSLLLERLAGAGARATVRVPEDDVADTTARAPDLVLLKSATTLAVSLAVAEQARGTRTLNHADATLRAHDKAAAIARLAAAGVPVPETWLVAPGGGRPADPADRGGWIGKPTRGVHGRGITRHAAFPAAADLAPVTPPAVARMLDDGTRLAQRQVGTGEDDIKVYVAGRRQFAGRKAFGPSSYTDDRIAPVTLDAAVADAVHASGEALGLTLFGVDLREHDGRIAVIDVNPFPGYRGFPDAVGPILHDIREALR